ncbi:hypothetical protein M405DRAFT_601919 [Rhizopogon salebrosus TDB-379]|nr:hypothetical protein M405DRAFT_601919 [Rhizopogon salebrosus TDB-379]
MAPESTPTHVRCTPLSAPTALSPGVTLVASPMHQKRTGRSANRASGNTAGPANPTAQGLPRYVRRLSLGFAASAYSAFWFALLSTRSVASLSSPCT